MTSFFFLLPISIPLCKCKILPFVTAWIDLENIMLIEISQLEKDKYNMISLNVESNEQT